MNKYTLHLILSICIFTLGDTAFAQQLAGKRGGNDDNFIDTSGFGGVLSHQQFAPLGLPTGTWAWIGRPFNLPREEYGLRLQDQGHLAKMSLTRVGSSNVRTFDFQWGGSSTSNLNYFFNPNGDLFNRRLIMRLRPNGFLESYNRMRSYANFDNTAEYVELRHTGNSGFVNSHGDGTFDFRINGLSQMRLTNSGRLAINRNPSSFTLDVGGNARNSTGIWSTSDERYKQNIKQLGDVSSKIMRLNGMTYKFKTEQIGSVDLTDDNGREHIGFIAQDVEELFPELVLWDEEGYCALRYEGLIPVLVEGFKEQQVEIAQYKQTAQDLKNELQDLEARFQDLVEVVAKIERN